MTITRTNIKREHAKVWKARNLEDYLRTATEKLDKETDALMESYMEFYHRNRKALKTARMVYTFADKNLKKKGLSAEEKRALLDIRKRAYDWGIAARRYD
ncbi:hypothetical protein LNKW23_48000 [Paralimibaculum aggregatum]|uniref:Uncharacterized protein n=1 Tax=Paralimibaculum aggregatum TaxID=3036245 RepID=A0ABQ6LU17_9RHOB|nr:hypothetical protein [Limibaculum sp. NKW23]GMG85577.1 hypothetical protein LNKW23_48000 [Limibaculum sp. NKW23]